MRNPLIIVSVGDCEGKASKALVPHTMSVLGNGSWNPKRGKSESHHDFAKRRVIGRGLPTERTRASPLGGPESQLDQGSKSISDAWLSVNTLRRHQIPTSSVPR